MLDCLINDDTIEMAIVSKVVLNGIKMQIDPEIDPSSVTRLTI